MLKKKPSEKIVETKIRKQSVKTLHTEDLEAKALALVLQFEARDKFQKLHAAIARNLFVDAEIAIKSKMELDAGYYYNPYVPLVTLPEVFWNGIDKRIADLKDAGLATGTVAIDPYNPLLRNEVFGMEWNDAEIKDVPPWFPGPDDLKAKDFDDFYYGDWNTVSELWFSSIGFKRGKALEDINAKRTYLWVEKQLKEVLEMNIGDLNDEITRERITSAIAEFIRPNVYDYTVTCNETNNTPYTVDQNELHVDVHVKVNKDSESVSCHGKASYRGIECSQ